MYRIGFRQFNVNGTVNNVENDVITPPPSTSPSTERNMNKITNNDVTIQPSDWYMVIQNDDVMKYDDIMTSFADCRLGILQGKFTFQADMHLSKLAKEMNAHCTFETPFILACAFGSKLIIQKMVEHGVDVTIRERSGINFVHGLIHAAAENREQEQMYVDVYILIMDQTGENVRRELLAMEDKDGYRPVELAVRKGTYGLFKVVFNTVGVYRDSDPAGQLGLHTFIRYDISEYENYESRYRELKSPLRLVNYMAEKHLKSYLKFDVHSMPAMKRWREKKIKSALPIITVWYIFKFIFVTTVTFLDASRISAIRTRDNKTHVLHPLSTGDPVLDDTLITTMTVCACLIFLAACVMNIKQMVDCQRRIVDKHVKHNIYLVHSDFFTYVQVIMCGLVVVQFIMAYSDASVETIYGVKAVLIPFGLLSYLQIFLVVPYIDRFVIALQRMVIVLVKFVVIHIVVRTVFCLFLMNTESQHPDQNFNNLNDAFYGIFLLDLNIIQLETPFYLQFTHVAFFYISGVLLINYLIAVMSDLAAEVNQYGVIICDLTKLDLAYQAQENFGRYIWRCATEPSSFLIIKVEDSKSIRSNKKETENIVDPEKYDIDN